MNTLFDYQKKTVELFLQRKRLALWSDTGTGKSIIFLACADALKDKGKILYLGPCILKEQIAEEATKWTSLRTSVIKGTPEERARLWSTDAELFIANYELLLNDFDEIQKQNFAFVCADEAHRIKSPTSKIVKRLKKLTPMYRLAMGAHIAVNGLYEWWSVADWLYPTWYGRNFYAWRSENCKLHPAFPQIIGYFNELAIRKSFAIFTHRIRREDVLSLPPLTEKRIECELSPAEKKRYTQLKNECVLKISEDKTLTVPNVLAMLTRLRQLVDAPYILTSKDEMCAKQNALRELLEVYENEKVIVFFDHAQVLMDIARHYSALVIQGETPARERVAILQQFQSDPQKNLLFGTAAMSEGLNIQCARVVIHYQMPLTHMREEQRNGRIHRIGQEQSCTSFRIIARDTIDERIERIVEKKRRLNNEDLIKLFE